jgi:1-acyl-sn-glycerol-3-phosphate acyltransferase
MERDGTPPAEAALAALAQLTAEAGGVAGGWLRMVEAVVGDWARAVDLLDVLGAESSDPFDAWDPDYIRATMPSVALMTKGYFRGEVEGLEHIPPDEPVLLVGNHSGGTLIADTFVFAHAFYEHFGPHRRFHQLAHDLVFKTPGVRQLVGRWGTVPAHPDNMRRALREGAPLLVYPGGDHESYRPTWESARVDFAGRQGFVRLALELGVPIVPVAAIGGQETALFMGRGRRFARALRLDRAARLKVLPVQLAPPFGMTVLDLPLRVPLPAKVKVRVLEPIDLRAELGAEPEPRDGYDIVTRQLQVALDELAAERALPLVG